MSRRTRERAAFVRANTRLLAPPLAPALRLHLADEAVELWGRTERELDEIGLPPPFWAFAWAGGQALARYVGDNPECVAGKCVLDFASGSGLVAIAAAKAGAARVEASEIDEFAQVRDRLERPAERRRRSRAGRGRRRRRSRLGRDFSPATSVIRRTWPKP